MSRTAIAVIVTVAVAAAAFGGWWWISSLGHTVLVDLAREKALCGDPGCIDGTMHIYTVIGQEYELSPATLDWCLGVDEFAATKTRPQRGGWIKGPLFYLMRLPCGRLTEGT